MAWWFLTSVPDETERRNDGDGKKMVLSMAEFGESQHGLRKAGAPMFSFRALPANSCDILIRMAKRKSTAQFTRSSATLRSTPARLGRLQPPAIGRFLFGLANGMVPLSHRQYINTWPLGFEVISRIGLFPARQVIRAGRD